MCILGLFFICILNAVSAVSNIDQSDGLPSFASFVQQHGRKYKEGETEYTKRKALYEGRLITARTHNSRKDKLWTARTNKLWDWTDSELATLRGWRHDLHNPHSRLPAVSFLQGKQASILPETVSWLNLTATQKSKVRNQGACGSCWAVAAAAMLEANHEIAHNGQYRTFSAQELVSCVQNPRHCGGDGGCTGATVELALEYVMNNGLSTEEEEPYQAISGQCHNGQGTNGGPSFLERRGGGGGGQNSAAKIGMTSWLRLQENGYLALMEAIVKGPVGSSVAASSWFPYDQGIFDGCQADSVIDHAVLLIGYGKEDDTKYWRIQNSWGGDWGENGTMRLLRHDDDEHRCGTDYSPEKGTACQGGPPKVTVCGMCGVLYDNTAAFFTVPS